MIMKLMEQVVGEMQITLSSPTLDLEWGSELNNTFLLFILIFCPLDFLCFPLYEHEGHHHLLHVFIRYITFPDLPWDHQHEVLSPMDVGTPWELSIYKTKTRPSVVFYCPTASDILSPSQTGLIRLLAQKIDQINVASVKNIQYCTW